MMMVIVQDIRAQEYFSSASNFARLYVGAVEPQYQTWLWNDIPYYKDNANMYQGRVSYHGVVYEDVLLRFDQYKQNVVVLSPIGNVFCLPEKGYVDWFDMDGYRFVHDPEDSTRFAALLCDGGTNGLRLYHAVRKLYNGMIMGDNMAKRRLYTEEHYTLITPDGEKHHVARASDITKLFPEQKKQIKQFVKRNRLSFTKSLREKSLEKVVQQLRVDSGQLTTDSSWTSQAAKPSDDYLTSTESRTSESSDLRGNHNSPLSTVNYQLSTINSSLIKGIPVLDNDTVATTAASANTKTYVVPGAKKARASIADDQELAEIVVVAGRQSAVKSTTMSSEKFKPQLLKNIPSAFGESDIMKVVLTLPGVTTVGEASSGYNVRGGATDQNLILFNGGTVYNPSHLFGLFTSFNSDAVEDVELFKSSIPAEYGGRISSVLKVTSKEANMQKLTGSASIGALTSKVNLEIPIVKEHVSLLLNGRTTYSDWMLKELPENSGYKDGTANFFDLGGVLTWKLNSRHRLKTDIGARTSSRSAQMTVTAIRTATPP